MDGWRIVDVQHDNPWNIKDTAKDMDEYHAKRESQSLTDSINQKLQNIRGRISGKNVGGEILAAPVKAAMNTAAIMRQMIANAKKTISDPSTALEHLAVQLTPPKDPEKLTEWAMNFSPSMGIVGQIGPLYHGSPYKFSKFANEKIGTGEGAQAFGYGHYLTDAKDIAGEYAFNRVGGKSWHLNINGKPLSEHPIIKKTSDPIYTTATTAEALKKALDNSGGDLFLAKKYLEKNATYNMAHQRAFDIIRDVKNVKDIDFGTNLYTTTVNKGKPSSEDVFLEWDKPVTRELRSKIESILPNMAEHRKDALFSSGESLYSNLKKYVSVGHQADISKKLSELGITGIKYPAGTLSGVDNSKATNYVIFDPERITIDKVE